MDMYDKIIRQYHEEHKHELDSLSENARKILLTVFLNPFENKDNIIVKIKLLKNNEKDNEMKKYYDEILNYISNL